MLNVYVTWSAFTGRSLDQLFCETIDHHWCIVCSFFPKQIQQMSQSNCPDFHPPKYQFKKTYNHSSSKELIVNSWLASKCMLLDIEMWTTLKEIRSFSCWVPPTDLVRINYHPSSVYPWGFCRVWPQRQHMQINKIRYLHMDHNVTIGGRLLTENLARQKCHCSTSHALLCLKRTVFWAFCQILGHNMMTWWYKFWKDQHRHHPQCHHLLLVSRIIHINSFLVSALVGSENQVQHGTIKTIVGLRLLSDGWDFWSGELPSKNLA